MIVAVCYFWEDGAQIWGQLSLQPPHPPGPLGYLPLLLSPLRMMMMMMMMMMMTLKVYQHDARETIRGETDGGSQLSATETALRLRVSSDRCRRPAGQRHFNAGA